MDIEHQVLQVGVNTCLSINCSLFIGQQVVELNYANRNCLKLLSFKHDLLQDRVLNHLVSYNCCKVACFGNIPPIIAVQ